ncbi:hypothetical protein DCAR_0310281 [Daucus carota subsp. sativus]|uniref:Arf-GAP domain-containing protein n=1 Tax=Daucus carota subsp. sativus TaxID=79200 RepID=A0AAF1AQ35_DAUCS|nr:hypothetical protein DCAR_0310281 [Daucus carota subsp. sativus]
MLTRKAEERNEKIIRGLMKLPPNRRCINCNTVGPQFVCTDFWTFVCMNCSGIHREFTHRVKSVSMSRFTSQEVEALQRGGNQRAREIFLNDWDPQRHRFPNGSNADKVREFIKNVYVHGKYAAGKTSEKPPRILQDLQSPEDISRRASSYHFYSQSPPYDYQYEERGYGKQAFALVRKAGSDRGLKTSGSFSPSRIAGAANEENFVDEYSNSRSTNYSTSTASSPYRSSNQSPSTQSSIKFSSSSDETFRERVNAWNQKANTFSDTDSSLDRGRASSLQRTTSNSSFASFSSSFMPFSSANSENDSGTRKVSGTRSKLNTFLSLPSSTVSRNRDSPDLFDTVFASQTVTHSTTDSDLFHSHETSSNLPLDLFQPSSMSLISTASCLELSPASQALSSDEKASMATLNQKSSDLVNQQNGRWATFDGPQNMEPCQGSQSFTVTSSTSDSDMFKSPEIAPNIPLDLFQPSSMSLILTSSCLKLSSASQPTSSDQKASMPTLNEESSDPVNQQNGRWETFAGPQNAEAGQGSHCFTGAEITYNEGGSVSNTNQHLFQNTNQQWNAFYDYSAQVTYSSMPIHWHGSQHNSVSLPSGNNQAGALLSTTNRKSTNPFDIAYESDAELSNMVTCPTFSTRASATAYSGGATGFWFTQNSGATYVPPGPQGTFGLYGEPVQNTQQASVPSKGSGAPVGGNPFA